MSDADETKELRRGIRTDLVIAACALVISMAATAASWWQSRVVADQLSAQVWPYLSISTTYDPDAVSVSVDNNGLGPAIIRSTVLSIDGKPVSDPQRALASLIRGHKKAHINAQMSDLGPGDVIRASGSVRLFRLGATWVVPLFARNASRLNLSVCYCSLLGNCWMTSTSQDGDPTPVRHCAAPGKAQYKVPVVIGR
jgi:hypothetical protein